MQTNPFKFGTVVDGPYFTDREDEIVKISSFIKGENHLILISPRRFGKTSLIKKVITESKRQSIYLDMQLAMTPEDFAAQLLKRIYRLFPFQKLKDYIKTFRVIPSVTVNPVTGETDVSFKQGLKVIEPLEDVLNLIEKLGSRGEKIIVVLDEFQEIFRINSGLDRILRATMQNHKNINYLFLGSSESLIRDIFEKKKSPFYHFGYLMVLNKIPEEKFASFLEERFSAITKKNKVLSETILNKTGSHPYYTQQLAFQVWELLNKSGYSDDIIQIAVNEIVQSHDNDYERLWNNFNRTDMMLLIGMSDSDISPLTEEFSKRYGTGAISTVFSSIQRLTRKGVLIRSGRSYMIDDLLFRRWINVRREV
jgi:hypothetical protein